jgi:biofilm PGA synthesis N-glycosyltransferase PgaC
MSIGWRTKHFSELPMKHWKREGAGIGLLRTNIMHGEIYYLTGGSLLFFALKVLHRFKSRPFVVGGLATFWGYARAAIRRQQRLVTREEARCYRSLLNQRIFGRLTRRLQAA